MLKIVTIKQICFYFKHQSIFLDHRVQRLNTSTYTDGFNCKERYDQRLNVPNTCIDYFDKSFD